MGHWACLETWLKQSSSCPCCRFELPKQPSQFDGLVEKSLAAVASLQKAACWHSAGLEETATEQCYVCMDADERASSPPRSPNPAGQHSRGEVEVRGGQRLGVGPRTKSRAAMLGARLRSGAVALAAAAFRSKVIIRAGPHGGIIFQRHVVPSEILQEPPVLERSRRRRNVMA